MNAVIPIAKLSVHVVSSLGVYKVVGDIIKNNVSVVTKVDKVKVFSGSIVLSSVIADTASKHINAKMDEFEAWNKKRKSDEPIAE